MLEVLFQLLFLPGVELPVPVLPGYHDPGTFPLEFAFFFFFFRLRAADSDAAAAASAALNPG